MMKQSVGCVVLLLVAAFALAGCEKAEDVGRSVVHKTGKIVGQGATEFLSGVGEGVKSVTDGTVPDVLTAISTRKSIRKFDASKEVDSATVEKLLKAAMCAPSAMNKQPWEFFVVRDAEKLAALAQANPFCRVGNGAKLAIVVCGNTDNGLPGRGKEYWIHDCSAATENLLLAAHGLGLGAVWTGVYPGEERIASTRAILGIPEGYEPLNIIPIGYPAEDPPVKNKWNPAKVHYDRW